MKVLTVSALVCALMALTTADEEGDIFKRSGNCGDWFSANGRCFLYHPTPTTWVDAEKFCQGYPGGHLASVDSNADYSGIKTLMQRYEKSPVAWIGGSDAEKEGTWLWCDGSYFRPPNWTPRRDHSHKNCLMMKMEGVNKFEEDHCVTPHPFVCAKKPQ